MTGGTSYVQTNLVSDIPGLAAHTDANLRNPWATSAGPGLPIWVSDNATGVTTLYDGAGNLKQVAPNQPSVAIDLIQMLLEGRGSALGKKDIPRNGNIPHAPAAA
jgi:hypothetical protein